MNISYPEWFKVEKEAALIIHRLSAFNDLTFYLNNSNPYIRQQAIIRLSSLKPVEAINMLEDIVNNPLETLKNRELAFLTISSIAKSNDLNLFITNPIADKLSSKEDYEAIIEPVIIEPENFRGLFFSPPPLYSEPDLEEEYLLRDNEVDFQISFDYHGWAQAWQASISSKFTCLIKNIPTYLSLILKKIKNTLLILFRKKILYLKAFFIKLFYLLRNKIDLLQILRSIPFYFLRLILAPFRLFWRNKLIIFLSVLFLFLYIDYTSKGFENPFPFLKSDSGKSFEGILNSGQEIFLSAWSEASYLSNLFIDKIRATNAWENIQDYFYLAIDFIKR